jgi:hypothetical protein
MSLVHHTPMRLCTAHTACLPHAVRLRPPHVAWPKPRATTPWRDGRDGEVAVTGGYPPRSVAGASRRGRGSPLAEAAGVDRLGSPLRPLGLAAARTGLPTRRDGKGEALAGGC